MTHNFYKTEPEIIDWLNSMKITDYKLIPDKEYGFMVDVKGYVVLENKKLTHIPIKFNIVTADFYCEHNELTSLIGCPNEVYGSFSCSDNKITSLLYIPDNVGGEINLENNPHPFLKNLHREYISYKELYSLHIVEVAIHEKKLLNDNIKVFPKNTSKKVSNHIHKV